MTVCATMERKRDQEITRKEAPDFHRGVGDDFLRRVG